MTTAAQQSLNNFYRSVQFSYPSMASQMIDDIEIVALNALSADNGPGRMAAERLRRQAQYLPVLLSRVLDNALTELGYS